MTDANNWFGFVETFPGAPAVRAETFAAPPNNSVRVSLQIGGGPPEQKYQFAFSLDPDGSAHCEFNRENKEDVSEHLDAQSGKAEFDAGYLREPSIELAGKASTAPMRPPAFPPDSLIGQLRIETAGGRIRTYFMADPDQASTAGMPPPHEIQNLTNNILQACENATGSSKLRP